MGEESTAPDEHLHRQPILTRPYAEPSRHWKTVDGEVIDEIVDRRRWADRPLPIGGASPLLGTVDSDEGNAIDRLREEVRKWRDHGWPDASNASEELLEYWSREPGEGSEPALFFAQREAIEAVIYLTEVGRGSHWMVRRLAGIAEEFNHGLMRLAIRMATGTGKTAVMACLIAWYAVNRKHEHRADPRALARNVDRIVVICPGRTIRDRLRVLDPRQQQNIYDTWHLVPPRLRPRLNSVRVNILNWEKLQPRTGIAFRDIEIKSVRGDLSRKKAILLAGGETVSQEPETPQQTWSRILGTPRSQRERVVVLNDEGHHCWERKKGEKSGIWMEALHALRDHPEFELAQAIDLSATPIFIDPNRTHMPDQVTKKQRTSLFPWVISEFALMDSMEAGLVKIPQPPRGDNTGHESALRNLFEANGGKLLNSTGSRALVLQGAQILYADYEETFEQWANSGDPRTGRPVMIVVANRRANARALFEVFGGRRINGQLQPGEFQLFSNVPRPGADESECVMRTILVHSKDNAPETKEKVKISGGFLGIREIGKDATEEEMRKVLQSVAQPGQAGATVRCVISVGMLTEGWDCQRVTHILGYRKFDSQLLCEQTMGRALRRHNYANREDVRRRDNGNVESRFPAEYAVVFGVPFERQMAETDRPPPSVPDSKTEVFAVPERVERFRIWVPNFSEYTVSASGIRVELDPARAKEVYPREGHDGSEIQWVVAGGPIGRLRRLKRPETPEQPGAEIWQLAAELAQLLSEQQETADVSEGEGRMRRGMLFGECLKVVRQWLALDQVQIDESHLGGDGMRELAEKALLDAVTVGGQPPQMVGVPHDPRQPMVSAGDWRPFVTGVRDVVQLEKSELNVAACDSRLETDIVRTLESLDVVDAVVRNFGPDRVEIPYKIGGGWKKYVPDFFVRCKPRDGRVPHIVLEGKGVPDAMSEKKGWWTDHWWVPCANAAGAGLGQVWVRREVYSATEVRAAVDSAIEEVCSK